jgi:hypothetical protein
MPARRWGSAEANVKTKWMLAGGYVFDGTVDTISNSTVQYDPGTNTWAAKDPMLAARSRMGGDSVGVAMYAVGGRDPVAGGFNGTTDNQRFIDLCQGTATPTFTGTPPTNTPTRTLTNTPIPTATACGSYAIATGTATLVPGVTLVTGSQGDDLVAAVALPFPFSFYGTPFSSANVSTNGNLQFSSTNTAFTNVCLPTATMNNLISPHWDDLRTDATLGNCTLYTGGQCGIFTDLQGSVGTRVFTIEWRAIYFSPTTQRANFEIKLFEADNHIEFVYGLVEQGGSSATIGVQQGTGTLFTQYACNTAGSITANLQDILTPQGCATATPTAIPTSTATPTPAGIINGHLTWQNVLAANRPAVTGTLTLCNAGVPQNYAVSTNTNGDFTIATGLPDGTYNWRLKGGRHLATSGTITFSGGSATMDFGLQRGGDAIQSPASQNNIVNSSDFNALKLVFGQGGTFSSDFDYNGVVNSSDFNILKLNFGQAGAPVNCP